MARAAEDRMPDARSYCMEIILNRNKVNRIDYYRKQ